MKRFKNTLWQVSAAVLFAASVANAQDTVSQTAVLTLDEAIAIAVEKSPRMGSAKLSLVASEGAERQAGAFLNPEVTIEGENFAGSGAYRAADSAEFTYGLAQKLEIGKRGARREIAQAERETATLDVSAAQLDLERDVKVAYIEAVTAKQQLEIARAQEELAKTIHGNVSKRVRAARDPLVYLSQAQISLANAQMAVTQAEQDMSVAFAKLSALEVSDVKGRVLDETVLTSAGAPLPLGDYERQLSRSPDVAKYAMKLSAKRSAVRLAKAQNIPDPTIAVGVRTFRETHDRALTVGLSLPIPVFDVNRGNIEQATAEFEQVTHDARAASIAVSQSLQVHWQVWHIADQEAAKLKADIVPAAEEALRLSREGYDRGRFAYLEILNAQRSLFDAKEQYLKALQRKSTAKAEIERITAASSNQQETNM